MRLVFGLTLAMLLASEPSAAASAKGDKDARFSAAYHACMAKAGLVDPAMRECEADEDDRLDRALNKVYRELLGKMDPDQKTALQKAERAWVIFRDAECDQGMPPEQFGTLDWVLLNRCLKETTADRLVTLRRRLD